MAPPQLVPSRHSARARARRSLYLAVALFGFVFTARNLLALGSGSPSVTTTATTTKSSQLAAAQSENERPAHVHPVDPAPMHLRRSQADRRRAHVLKKTDVRMEDFHSRASLTMVGDWPACDYHTACFTKSSFDLLTPVDASGVEWNPEMNIMRNCYNGNYTGAYSSAGAFWEERDSVLWLPGTTIVIDTFLMRNQFGHVGLKLIQSWSLMQSFYPDLISTVLLIARVDAHSPPSTTKVISC